MVSAVYGVLISCDIPTKVFILSLNEAAARNEKFVIQELSDTRLFVQPNSVEWLEERLREFQDKNTYQPPAPNQG